MRCTVPGTTTPSSRKSWVPSVAFGGQGLVDGHEIIERAAQPFTNKKANAAGQHDADDRHSSRWDCRRPRGAPGAAGTAASPAAPGVDGHGPSGARRRPHRPRSWPPGGSSGGADARSAARVEEQGQSTMRTRRRRSSRPPPTGRPARSGGRRGNGHHRGPGASVRPRPHTGPGSGDSLGPALADGRRAHRRPTGPERPDPVPDQQHPHEIRVRATKPSSSVQAIEPWIGATGRG